MYDLIGDVHGCIDELEEMLKALGYVADLNAEQGDFRHPSGRKIVFVGDLNDRGPDSSAVIKLAMTMHKKGNALCVIGNHDDKLMRYLKGSKITPGHGLAETIAQLEKTTPAFRDEVKNFLSSLPIELILDDGKLSVSHAGLPEHLQGVKNGKAKSHALFGDVEGGKKDENGYPVRRDWAQDYKGSRIVVHGHTPMKEHRTLNNVWCIDTGCPFGGKLTALRYPEMQIVQVQAKKNYQPFHPFGQS